MNKTNIINLRSDTVTKPSQEMLEAMCKARIGDDAYGNDPTVKELEDLAAFMLGKEAGLFVTSGTMGNLVSVLSQTSHGDSILLDSEAHLFRCEKGNIASIAGVLPKCIKVERGVIKPEEVKNMVIEEGRLYAKTTLLSIENPHNGAGGTIINKDDMDALCNTAHELDLKVHVDGARIFNAASCSGVEASSLVEGADTVTFCLTKDLGCPYGSVVVGNKETIRKALKMRQMLGGGMRQAGIMAAAGIYALKNNITRLEEDHQNALLLAKGLLNLGFEIDLETINTNMVYGHAPSGINNIYFCEQLLKEGVLVNMPQRGKKIRYVTHIGITDHDIKEVIEISKRILSRC